MPRKNREPAENLYEKAKAKSKLVERMHRTMAFNAIIDTEIANAKENMHALNMAELNPEHIRQIAEENNRNVYANRIEGNTHNLYYQNPTIKELEELNKAVGMGTPISGDALARAKRGEPPHFSTDVTPRDR